MNVRSFLMNAKSEYNKQASQLPQFCLNKYNSGPSLLAYVYAMYCRQM